MITSKYGPPFNEGNYIKSAWERRKQFIKAYIESQIPADYSEQVHNPELFILEMLMDLWAALAAEEKDSAEYAVNLSYIYDEATGGLISIPNTKVDEVIRILYQRLQDSWNDGHEEGYTEGWEAGIAGAEYDNT